MGETKTTLHEDECRCRVRRNCDGALGGVLRDWNGCVQGAFISSTPKLGDVALIEALAVEKGVRVAMEAGVKNLIIESDSRLVVDMLNSNCKDSSMLGTVCLKILDLRCGLDEVVFKWIPRVCNKAADCSKKNDISLICHESVHIFANMEPSQMTVGLILAAGLADVERVSGVPLLFIYIIDSFET
ncbi:putative ribonuclease H protein [Senna tora]|uniref:Putative ribonuclease H protein n=1 Tax=Senna tora TaxID=362788 RepID=A0A835C3V9_9FABA|nr:putative ribonuclease H protein [Senna tora]